jgi:hypothetical protein
MARHPFQRKSNPKDTVRTPFQRALVDAIDLNEAGGAGSGRRVSELLKRSANHVSLMMNDGFIPAGATVVEMAEALGLNPAARDELILAAVETKASQRSRDHFWLNEVLRFYREAQLRAESAEAFVAKEGRTAELAAFRQTFTPTEAESAIRRQRESQKSEPS